VPGKPSDAVVVKSPDGKPIKAGEPPTTLIAPSRADFHKVYAAGRAIASLPLWSQIPRIRTALHQGGTYDFQRDPVHQKFFPAYTNASNYAVGVYMAGAGQSLSATLLFAETYALFNSSNYDKQRDWITRGWDDATAGWWKPAGENKRP
jgi:hypothetical protein